jgi:predicted transcriptional regulator
MSDKKAKRKPYEVKLRILQLLRENQELSYTKLQTKLSTNYDSVKNNCEELEFYGFIEIKEYGKHPENGKPYYILKLTNSGFDLTKKKPIQR